MEMSKDDNKYNLIEILLLLWKQKFVLLSLNVVITILIVIYAMMQPNLYRSRAVFTPMGGDQGSSMSAALSQYSGIASLAGVSLPSGGTSGNMIGSLLSSRTLRDRIVRSLDLASILFKDVTNTERDLNRIAEEKLRKMIEITNDTKNGTYELSVESEDPELATKIAIQLLMELEELLNEVNLQNSLVNITMTEKRVKEQSKKVEKTQREMVEFQSTHKLLDPSNQSQGYYSLLSSLINQKIQSEMQLQQLEISFSASDSRVQAAKNQLESIKSQLSELENTGSGLGSAISKAPDIMIKYQNLLRDLEIAQRIYATLLAGLEQGTLNVNESQTYIQVIDPPIIPDVKSGPNRFLIILVGSLLSGLFSIFIMLTWIGLVQIKYNFLSSKASLNNL